MQGKNYSFRSLCCFLVLVVAIAKSQTAPNITSLSPSVGPVNPVGGSVTIKGSAFGSTQGSSTLSFGGVTEAASSWSDTQIVAAVPSTLAVGFADVFVTVNGTSSNTVSFLVIPVITQLSPDQGIVGTSVTITGTSFGDQPGDSTVTFDGVTAIPSFWSTTSITVPVPQNVSGYPSVVATINGFSTNGPLFIVLPNITSVSPAASTAGSPVTIFGTGFGNAQGFGSVTFNGINATVQSWSNTAVTVTVPEGATGDVGLTNSNLLVSNGVTFTEIFPLAIVAAPDPVGNGGGWYNAAVTISFHCTGGLAPVNCPPSQNVTSEGSNQTISGTATDSIGNTASTNIVINLDKTAPTVTIGVPLDGTTVTRSVLRVTGSVSDGLSGVASVTCNGAQAVLSSGSFTCNVPLTAASNSIQAQAIDNAGNVSGSNQISITYNPATPNGIFITPGTANMVVGNTRSVKLVGDLGQSVSGATWTISDPSIVGITNTDPPQVTAVAPGSATLTASLGQLQASMTVGVFSGTALPFGTPLWSAGSITGSFVNGISAGNPVNDGDPDVYVQDGDNTLEGFTTDGQMLWATAVGGNSSSGSLRTLLIQSVADNSGNVINVVYKCLVSNCHTFTPAIIAIDNGSQSQLWENDLNDGPYLSVSSIAIASDNTIYLSGVFETGQEDNTGIAPTHSLIAVIDGATGQTKSTLPIDPSHVTFTLTDGNGNVIQGQNMDEAAAIGPMAVMADGSVQAMISTVHKTEADTLGNFQCFLAGLNQCATSISNHLKLQLLSVPQSGGSSLEQVRAYDFDANNCTPCHDPGNGNGYTPGNVIPDGLGGILAEWTEAHGAIPSVTSAGHIHHVDNAGSVQDYDLPGLSGQGAPRNPGQDMVLGANNVAFHVGQKLISFDVTSGAQLCSTASLAPRGATLIAPTTDFGVLGTELQSNSQNNDAMQFFDTSCTPTIYPLPASFSAVSLLDDNTLLGITSDPLVEAFGSPITTATATGIAWLQSGNKSAQRAPAPPQITFDKATAIAGISLINRDVRATIKATIKPMKAASKITFHSTNGARAKVSEESRVDDASSDSTTVTLRVQGIAQTPTDKPKGDAQLQALLSNNPTGAKIPILVVIPSTQEHAVGTTTLTNTSFQMTLRPFKFVLSTSVDNDVTITIKDQFGNTLDSVYDGLNVVTETFSNISPADCQSSLEQVIVIPDNVLKSGIKLDRTGSQLDFAPDSQITAQQQQDWTNQLPVLGHKNAFALAGRGDSCSGTQAIKVHGYHVTPDFQRSQSMLPQDQPPIPYTITDTASH